jgi:hypothetical protein
MTQPALREDAVVPEAGLLVISSCTARKAVRVAGRPLVAEDLYLGQQHVRLMRGVRDYRHAGESGGPLSFSIVSALHGVIGPDCQIAPYEFSFSGMTPREIERHAASRDIPQDMARLLATRFKLGLLLLSAPYIRACDLTQQTVLGGPVLAFCSPGVARRLPTIDCLRAVAVANPEARRFSCGLTSLKGELAGRILSAAGDERVDLDQLASPHTDVLDWIEEMAPTRSLALAS